MIFLQFVVAAAAFLMFDAVWLKSMSGFYRRHLTELMAPKPDFRYAAAFYLIYIAGIVFFALQPALQAGSWPSALGYGAALGFFGYATYDLTNAATLKSWPAVVVVVDLAWGTVLTGLITLVTWLVFA
ncbi:Uncharacterized membrane protein [Arthrobacter subterraneus]|uniref:Uncharacterized membrane protein n=1 Tax=Arthrobacter subterraneus TaxID=335973 RepID=A0A1G8EAQ5_9MICC|nr:DUF2177 family protein [Arthrobacter subterraneus]SDH66974.1 Uncharacterized membrane protein [Arthrobacter subterraneus]